MPRLVRAGLVTAVVDGLFSSALAAFVYDTGVMQLWQRVASTVLGPAAFDGGVRTMLIGLGMHVCVAFTWSAVFLYLVMRSRSVIQTLEAPLGVIKVASVYGPCIWLVMSIVVIPLLVHRPPTFNLRWWVQLLGHFPFVGLPIVGSLAPKPSGELAT